MIHVTSTDFESNVLTQYRLSTTSFVVCFRTPNFSQMAERWDQYPIMET